MEKKIDKFLFKKILLLNQNKKLLGKNKIIFKKNNKIYSKFNGESFYLYNGIIFRFLKINKLIFLYRYGNFVFTKKFFKYLIKNKITKR